MTEPFRFGMIGAGAIDNMHIDALAFPKANKANLARFRWIVFFLLVFAYLYLLVEPRLFFFAHGTLLKLPAFSRYDALAQDVFTHPGGVSEFASACMVRYFGIAWAGPAIMTLAAFLLFWSTNQLLASVRGKRGYDVGCIPAVLLLMSIGRYDFAALCMVYAVPTAVALALAAVYTLTSSGTRVRLPVLILFTVLVYGFGGATVLLFGAACAAHEILGRREALLGLTAEALAVAVAYLAGRFVYDVPLDEAFLRLTPFGTHGQYGVSRLHQVLYVFAPLAMVAGWCLSPARRGHPEEMPASVGWWPARQVGPAGRWLAHSLLLLAAAATAVGMSFDWQRNAQLRLNYSARLGRWADVLKHAGHLRRLPRMAILDVQRALYHTGRLADELFSYPHYPPGPVPSLSWRDHLVYAEMYFDMGQMNAAEEHSYAGMVMGEHPLILHLLGRIYLVKNRPDTARVFFNALKHDASCGHWADEYLPKPRGKVGTAGRAVVCPPSFREEAERLRPLTVLKDGLFTRDPIDQVNALLEANPENRMAFEYKMAWLLLHNRMDEIVRNLRKAKAVGCPGKMRLYQEAFLVHANDAEAQAPGFEIEPETRQRFRKFQEACASARSEEDRLRIAEDFGDSYFFYHRFGGRVEP